MAGSLHDSEIWNVDNLTSCFYLPFADPQLPHISRGNSRIQNILSLHRWLSLAAATPPCSRGSPSPYLPLPLDTAPPASGAAIGLHMHPNITEQRSEH